MALPYAIVQKLESRVDPVFSGASPEQNVVSIYFRLPSSTEQQSTPLLSQIIQSNFEFLQRKLATSDVTIQEAITIDSRIMHGNPVFSGTRVPLYQVFEELSDGTTISEMLEGYPSIRFEQLQAALEFAASLVRIYSD